MKMRCSLYVPDGMQRTAVSSIVISLAIGCVTFWSSFIGPDIWTHMANAKALMWQRFECVYSDCFTFLSAGERSGFYPWLSAILLYLTHMNFGEQGLCILRFILLSVSCFLVVEFTLHRTFWLPAAALVGLTAALEIRVRELRPELFSIVLLLWTYTSAFTCSRSKRLTVQLVLVGLVWPSLHAFAAIALFVSSAYVAKMWVVGLRPGRESDALDSNLRTLTASLLMGYLLHIDPVRNVERTIFGGLQYGSALGIHEFQHLQIFPQRNVSGLFLCFFFIGSLCCVVNLFVHVRTKVQGQLPHRLLEVTSIVLSIWAIRFQWMILFPLLGSVRLIGSDRGVTKFAGTPDGDSTRKRSCLCRWFGWVCVIALLVTTVHRGSGVMRVRPNAAAQFLSDLEYWGRVFSSQEDAGEIYFSNAERVKTAIDIRSEILSQTDLALHFSLVSATERWDEALSALHVQCALLTKPCNLLLQLNKIPSWKCVFTNGFQNVFLTTKRIEMEIESIHRYYEQFGIAWNTNITTPGFHAVRSNPDWLAHVTDLSERDIKEVYDLVSRITDAPVDPANFESHRKLILYGFYCDGYQLLRGVPEPTTEHERAYRDNLLSFYESAIARGILDVQIEESSPD